VTRLLIALAKAAKSGEEITDIIKDLPMPKEAAELRPTFARGCDFAALGKGVLADLEKFVSGLSYASPAPDNREGVRVNFDKEHGDGWALVRMSLHEPILPVNIESDTEGGVKKIAAQLYKFLQAYPFLELSAFDALLS
jgi:phosphomannomutase